MTFDSTEAVRGCLRLLEVVRGRSRLYEAVIVNIKKIRFAVAYCALFGKFLVGALRTPPQIFVHPLLT